jgi:hypothetical protein
VIGVAFADWEGHLVDRHILLVPRRVVDGGVHHLVLGVFNFLRLAGVEATVSRDQDRCAAIVFVFALRRAFHASNGGAL